MRKFLFILILLLISNPVFAAGNLNLKAENPVQLISHASQYAIIKGTISNIDIVDKSRSIFLNFGENFNTSFSAIIYGDAVSSFIMAGINEPAEYFKDKTVVLKGIIRISDGKPEIVINSPNQIKIITNKK
ncbi:MAG: hypothetical protein V2B14_01475 [bacterium]